MGDGPRSELRVTFFDTAIGCVGITWSDRGVVGVQLPESTEGATRARMKLRFPEATEARPPAAYEAAIDGIVALLAGEEAAGLREVEVDLRAMPEFNALSTGSRGRSVR